MKILKRTAPFDNLENASAPLSSQNIKLNLSNKAELFVTRRRVRERSAL